MFKKIIDHLNDYGFIKTISWLYNCIIFKMKSFRLSEFDFKTVKIAQSRKKYLLSKTLPNVFIVASVPYYDIGGGQRCSQLAKAFNKAGYNVIYLYAYKSQEFQEIKMQIPVSAHLFINNSTLNFVKKTVQKNDLFIFEAPSKRFEKILSIALESNTKIVYENIDNWETSLGNNVLDEKMLIKLLTSATLLTGTAKTLVNQLEKYLKKYNISKKEILYSPNAVDEELFCGAKNFNKPEDLITDKKTFLYYGSLWGEWFDWDLLIDFALDNPRYSFNLIGDYSGINNILECCPHNIHFLGLKRQTDLPAYLKYTDYAMIPFKTGDIGDYVSPLKVFEYISMYSKVLTTSLPDIKDYPNVYYGNTIEQWKEIIDKDYEVNYDSANDFIQHNTWSNRVDNIIDRVYPEFGNSILKDDLSIIILNYNNKNIIFKSIDSLIKFNELYNYEIIVVDNGSTDGSYKLLEKKYKNKIKLIKNNKNGCSSGRNLGVEISTKNNIMFLDSDQWVVSKYWLQPYETIIKKYPDYGLIGWAAGFFNKKGYAFHVVDSFEYRYLPPNMLCCNDISYLGSGGMLMTKDTFIKIGGFDEKYDPTCYEDTDLSLKVRNIRKEIYYCQYLGLVHLPHQTTKSGSKTHTQILNEKKIYFKDKWLKENKKLLKMFVKKG